MDEIIRGYKVFNPDWTCRGFQYACPGIFEEDVDPEVYERGFHFCLNLADCFSYYPFNPENKVAEIICLGRIAEEGNKCCTNKIEIVRELTWEEVLRLVNTGKGCSGLCNSGNWNSGNRNSGNRNSGNRNSGNWNSGNRNSGDWNIGDWNSGDWNSGDCNSGNRNSGDWNSGNRNSGNRNSGDWNSGNRNSGNRNSGDWNSGDCNSGNWNSGDCNSGNWNSGNRNSGDWNKTNFSNGCFNTESPKIYLFNKPSDWTYQDWLNSDARYLLNQIPGDVLEYIYLSDMTDEEKKEHPEAKVTGGYLKELNNSECGQIWWDGLSEYKRNIIRSLPNFDPAIFEQITGIKIEN